MSTTETKECSLISSQSVCEMLGISNKYLSKRSKQLGIVPVDFITSNGHKYFWVRTTILENAHLLKVRRPVEDDDDDLEDELDGE